METTIMGYIGIIFGLYWGYTGIMENKMETTISLSNCGAYAKEL